MKKKLLAIATAMTLALSALTGCGGSGAATATTTSTLHSVLKAQKLVVGTCATNAPFSSYDAEGNAEGYDVEIAYLLGESLGIDKENVEIIGLNAPDRVTALETGKCDVVIGNFTITLERAQKIEFSNPYDASGTGVITAKGKEVEHAADLAGMKIGASKGSINESACNALVAAGVAIEVVLYDNSDQSEMALKSGQIDAIIGEAPYCAYKAKQEPDTYSFCAIDSEEFLVPASYNAFGVKQGDQIWLNYLNQFITDINNSGVNDALYEEWIGAERTVSVQ